jgi:hypothetical protein
MSTGYIYLMLDLFNEFLLSRSLFTTVCRVLYFVMDETAFRVETLASMLSKLLREVDKEWSSLLVGVGVSKEKYRVTEYLKVSRIYEGRL